MYLFRSGKYPVRSRKYSVTSRKYPVRSRKYLLTSRKYLATPRKYPVRSRNYLDRFGEQWLLIPVRSVYSGVNRGFADCIRLGTMFFQKKNFLLWSIYITVDFPCRLLFCFVKCFMLVSNHQLWIFVNA